MTPLAKMDALLAENRRPIAGVKMALISQRGPLSDRDIEVLRPVLRRGACGAARETFTLLILDRGR